MRQEEARMLVGAPENTRSCIESIWAESLDRGRGVLRGASWRLPADHRRRPALLEPLELKEPAPDMDVSLLS